MPSSFPVLLHQSTFLLEDSPTRIIRRISLCEIDKFSFCLILWNTPLFIRVEFATKALVLMFDVVY
jgi:hypothetical protein